VVGYVCVAKYNSGGRRGLKEAVAVYSPAVEVKVCDWMGRSTTALSWGDAG
jgi:hypothetical protein